MTFWPTYGEAARTAVGFFWKAGWAFVLGYWVSAMIQAFVPKARLTPYLGGASLRSVSLATVFGAASSSCSFAALAAARSLVLKGAHFVAAVAFMFASTNLVIELGILILIFLGWQFLVAELIGGLVLIALSSLLLRWTAPRRWLDQARERVEAQMEDEEEDFDWRQRIRSRDGWNRVGRRFVADWQMVWEEILIGFTVAGFVAVWVPDRVWQTLFWGAAGSAGGSSGGGSGLGSELGVLWNGVLLENVLVAPLVAAATFIGSMGNIPLATVLNTQGVLFGGILAFIYSDLMVPPLVMVNARYYGWRVALYIATVMYASITITAVLLHLAFGVLGLTPESGRRINEVVRFALDYTFYLNLLFVLVAGGLVALYRRAERDREDPEDHGDHEMDHGSDGGPGVKRIVAILCVLLLVGGWVALALTGG